MKFLNRAKQIGLVFTLPFILSLAACSQPGSQEFTDAVMKVIEENPDKVFDVITKHAQQEALNRRKNASGREKNALEAQFKNPLKPSTSNRPFLGPKNAPVTIVEYSDFQCPFCSKAHPTITRVLKEYKGKVKLIFKHLPLDFHPEALPAAKATVAAGNQGKFFEFHDELFENQRKLGKGFYLEVAKKLKLNVSKFKTDMNSAETLKVIEEDKKEASKMGISGTPGFIINGVALKGAYPFEQFKTIIDRHLKN